MKGARVVSTQHLHVLLEPRHDLPLNRTRAVFCTVLPFRLTHSMGCQWCFLGRPLWQVREMNSTEHRCPDGGLCGCRTGSELERRSRQRCRALVLLSRHGKPGDRRFSGDLYFPSSHLDASPRRIMFNFLSKAQIQDSRPSRGIHF